MIDRIWEHIVLKDDIHLNRLYTIYLSEDSLKTVIEEYSQIAEMDTFGHDPKEVSKKDVEALFGAIFRISKNVGYGDFQVD